MRSVLLLWLLFTVALVAPHYDGGLRTATLVALIGGAAVLLAQLRGH